MGPYDYPLPPLLVPLARFSLEETVWFSNSPEAYAVAKGEKKIERKITLEKFIEYTCPLSSKRLGGKVPLTVI